MRVFVASFILISFLIFCAFLQISNCLYEDQVGKFDWRQQYIGKIKFVHIDPTTAGSQRFVVATEENVLSCLSSRSGSILWRQIFESGKNGKIDAMSHEDELITISGRGQFIRYWDQNTGVLQYETSFPHAAKADSKLYFGFDSPSKEIARVELSQNAQAKISLYSLSKSSVKTSNPIDTPWYNDEVECGFVSSNYFVCIDKVNGNLHLLSKVDSGAFVPISLKSLGISTDFKKVSLSVHALPYQGKWETPYFVLHLDKKGVVLQIQPPGIRVVTVLNAMNQITSTLIEEKLLIFTLVQQDSTFQISGHDISTKSALEHLAGSFLVTEDRGDLENFYMLPYTKRDQGTSYKMLLFFSDHSVVLVHQQGKIVWSREEALSNIIAAEMMDLPLSDTDANIEQEFDQPDAGVIAMFLTRIKSQVNLFQSVLLQVLLGDKTSLGLDDQPLTRDTFGLHKMIVVITAAGKAFGIDNLSGIVVWSHLEHHLSPFKSEEILLYVQRTTAHWPFPPVCTAVGKDGSSMQTRLYSFNPITGATLDSQVLPYDVLQLMPSSVVSSHLRPILLLDSQLKVHVYPESHDISRLKDSHFMFTAESDTGNLIGYILRDEGAKNTLSAIESWRVKLPQAISQVITKNPLEHVHSQGRVMGDRSVLYKYLNPNLAAVFTEGSDAIHKNFCNVYLIDVITGLTVFSTSHKRCKSPIHAVHSENWLVYSYYSEKSRRVEISSIELFEGIQQSNTTAFSSLAPPSLPLVEHQTYIFPSNIIAMADTVTERGMTNKHILIVLPTGGILELPKTFLDPRRPITPLPEHREEGLIPYIPELPIMAESIINYNQSVQRVKGVVRAPSSLESTCLVFVHGLDLFYTRVTPSRTFDILKDDFDHSLIGGVLFALLILCYTTRRLAQRNTLRSAWK